MTSALEATGEDRAEVERLVEAARRHIAEEDGHPAALATAIAAWKPTR